MIIAIFVWQTVKKKSDVWKIFQDVNIPSSTEENNYIHQVIYKHPGSLYCTEWLLCQIGLSCTNLQTQKLNQADLVALQLCGSLNMKMCVLDSC